MRKPILLAALVASALAVAACGSSGGGSSSTAASSTTSSTTSASNGGGGGGGGSAGGGGGQAVPVSADPSGALKFTESSLTANAGNDTFQFTNQSPVTHDFCIEDSSGNQVGCSDQVAGGSSTLSANLKPGKYTFYCSVDSHRQAGMQGTLTVK